MYKKAKDSSLLKLLDIYDALKVKGAVFHPASGIISIGEEKKNRECSLFLQQAHQDIPVAEEAAVTALFLGSNVNTLYDVGVAGFTGSWTIRNILKTPGLSLLLQEWRALFHRV